MKNLFAEIERTLPEGGQWCDLHKAHTLASLVIGLRPALICEIGVWMGGSLIPMLLAQAYLGHGKAFAIDPWDAPSSVAGQTGDNAAWWQNVDHNAAYRAFLLRLEKHGLRDRCEVMRSRSDDVVVTGEFGLLHIDGNHADQAVRDVMKYAPHVAPGGILVFDDLGWEGGHVSRARDLATGMGFVQLYPLGTGVVMQRQGMRA